MAAEQSGVSKKRKRDGERRTGDSDKKKKSSNQKKPIPVSASSKAAQGSKKTKMTSFGAKDVKRGSSKLKQEKKTSYVKGGASSGDNNAVISKKDRRLMAKELAESRKKKRKLHYTLQQELALLWEKMRRRNIAKEERSKLVSEALRKMAGKMAEIASSHVSSRVLQTCVKYCSQAEKETVFSELHTHLLTLSRNVYGVHLVKKMLDTATKKQLDGFISSLHGKVSSLLRHMVGSVVVEHAYQLGNASQKQSLLAELYSPELQLFRDLTLGKGGRLQDIISKLGLKKASVLQHMSSVIQPIIEKGIIDHSIIHTLIIEYLSIADKSSAKDIIKQLSSSLFVRMIHTKDGSKLGILCVKHGEAKERKKIIKGIKEHIGKIAMDPYGSLVLACILSVVDDTKLLTKIIIRELQKILKDLVFDKNGRHPILQLLHPHCPRYLSPDDLASLDLYLPSLCSKGEGTEIVDGGSVETPESDLDEKTQSAKVGGKKDDTLRRYQLLVDSGLAESLIELCTECPGELLRSNFGREVIYEVMTSGVDAVLEEKYPENMENLRAAISALGALPRNEEAGPQDQQHVFEDFHSSRTLRKLILDSPSFAASLWNIALKGRTATWANGHSAKVVSAYLESTDAGVRELTESELRGLIYSGALKAPKPNDQKPKE
ncbi:pumilio 24 isoform X2 [Wolffia australiana]